MSIYQEAHMKIDQFPEETVYLFIQLMDQMVNTQKKKTTNKNSFLSSAGQIDIDENTINNLREASMI